MSGCCLNCHPHSAPEGRGAGEKLLAIKLAHLTCELGDEPPAAMAVGEEEGDQLLVLLHGPWPLLQTDLLAARLPPHLSPSLTVDREPKR